MMEVTRAELNGLGTRVNNMEQFKAAQEKENMFIHEGITAIKNDISTIFLKLDKMSGMQYKIVGAVAVIIVVAQLAIPWVLKRIYG